MENVASILRPGPPADRRGSWPTADESLNERYSLTHAAAWRLGSDPADVPELIGNTASGESVAFLVVIYERSR